MRFSGGARFADEQQREDVCQDALMRLLPQIRQCRLPTQQLVIEDLRGLTAVIARRSCFDYLRRKYPRRHSLKTRLHYLLNHQPGFSLWSLPHGEVITGYAEWHGQNPTGQAADRLAQLMKNASGHLPAETLTQECAQRRPADLVAAICDFVGGPVAFDDLVKTVAILWDVKEDAAAEDELACQPDTAAGALRQMEGREFLQELWTEMLQLPVRQRRALLLNLRDTDGGGCIALLPLTGVATMQQIAAALEMPAEQLAALWGRLPLDDLELATIWH